MDNKTIYHRFSQWVDRQPEAMAIVEDGRAVTYRQLDVMANAIMSKFYSKRYPTVGIIMSHGIEMTAAMLAVVKSGAAYVPAEPSLPRERAGYMMATAGAEFVITDSFCRNLPQSAAVAAASRPFLPRGSGLYSLYFGHVGASQRGGCRESQRGELCRGF